MRNNFQKMITNVQNSEIKLKILPTLACYIILISGIYYFIIYKNSSLLEAFLLGFFTYGVYETTNMSILKDWNYKIGIIDTIWGGILFFITTYLYLYIKNL
tara:strand:- start:2598 stop:2900 length:303 start_codon:yes stop_codon:yes gene_type:complete